MKFAEIPGWTAGLLALWLWAPCASGEVTFSALAAFDGANGAYPKGGLIQGKDGSFYGTTVEGGATNAGTVFCLSADGWVLKTLYSFTGAADGANPSAALAQGSDGSFYGTAYNGGAGNSGTLFQITPAGGFKLLASLSGANGAQPDAALIQASDGSWYGTADDGGPYTNVEFTAKGYGSIFCLTTNGELKARALFDNADGARAGALARAPTATSTARQSGAVLIWQAVLAAWATERFSSCPPMASSRRSTPLPAARTAAGPTPGWSWARTAISTALPSAEAGNPTATEPSSGSPPRAVTPNSTPSALSTELTLTPG